jgi:hypothetical protein
MLQRTLQLEASIPEPTEQQRKQAEKAKVFIMLSLNGVRDSVWEFINLSGYNCKLEETADVGEQWLAQQAAASAAVFGAMPLIALAAHKLYGIPYTLALKYTFVYAVATLAAIIPWNQFQQWGYQIGLQVTDNTDGANLFSSVIPGTGTIESPVQTITIHLLSRMMDPFYTFNLAEFATSSLYSVPGNVWQLVNATGIYLGAAHSTTGKILASGAVALGVGLANLSASKLSEKVGERYTAWKAQKDAQVQSDNTPSYIQSIRNRLRCCWSSSDKTEALPLIERENTPRPANSRSL